MQTKLKKYTLVTFILCGDTISRYFEKTANFQQITLMTGNCVIIDIQRVKGNFAPDYKKSRTSLSGYTAY